ncbi:patatin-like phospholipase family protein [uncultured Parasphingorhabdus sp.]|uniref:patatin-like phospholipase family protein n=1 Tax=uncultured Parasphingorhabdus sp. TaxID=2709694 RepID=UPI002AA94C6A|nr:patatin-like phospholipase family protein [uncultured Parasphingorhabdus sp.]
MPKIGLALSGGGSRAIAFHLGCLRALHKSGVLNRVTVLSSVSGGSVIAALYAFHDEPFEEFEKRVISLLKRGLLSGIARQTLFSLETPKIVAALLLSGSFATIGGAIRLIGMGLSQIGIGGLVPLAARRWLQAPVPRFASRSTAFERHLRKRVFENVTIADVARPGLDIEINAAELTTGTAFRFGSKKSGAWRFGALTGEVPLVSKAVAASACYPAALPSFDQTLTFEKKGVTKKHRVLLTDGGIYDNLGITCLLPGRSAEHSIAVHDVEFIIACDAGQGMPSGKDNSYLWADRMIATVNTIHRRTHSLSYELLHRMRETGQIKGFLLPYLGQIDEKLPSMPHDLVRRGQTFDYPTNFSAMKEDDIVRLSTRGEQLTKLLIDYYGVPKS